jgi:uncharacterized protein YndB with AHSA1/START domain
MPIKKDGTGKRWVEMELLVPGTPEQVWQAMATGAGNAAWFTKSEIEPRVGGLLRFDFGPGATSSGEVTMWEPPHQFSYIERGWEKDAPPVATEIVITSRSGDRCLVRMVHSLFTSSDDWDDQLEGFEKGWPGFFAVLRSYLTHFTGSSAASFISSTPASADSLSTWLRLCELLGLAGANVGEQRTASSGPEPWSGVVEHVHQDAKQRYVLLRLDAPSPGLVLTGTDDKGGSTTVSVCHFFYGENARVLAAESEPRTREWLSKRFGA